jgi:hypothetical protein
MSERPLVSGDRLMTSVERFEDHFLNHSWNQRDQQVSSSHLNIDVNLESLSIRGLAIPSCSV